MIPVTNGEGSNKIKMYKHNPKNQETRRRFLSIYTMNKYKHNKIKTGVTVFKIGKKNIFDGINPYNINA
jgi:hypothetical protein